MFTGLIEEVGSLKTVEIDSSGAMISVQAQKVLNNLSIGDSIAIDGACMTVTAIADGTFSFVVSPESLDKTHFSTFQPQKTVNLERPLTPTSRIGGHYVTGHIDGLIQLSERFTDGNCERFTLTLPNADWLGLIIPKGSVAILGVSLTVNWVEGNQFSVAVIPHTLANTTLNTYHPGDMLPFEGDMLGKYVQRFLALSAQPDPEMLVNDPALRPAFEALQPGAKSGLKANAPKSRIHSGGWFNFE
ncbi:MAG: riboflavin synthase [Cyanobacteria bacterium P01_H01_bin.74]